MNDRRLAAEVRAVEEGHHAFRIVGSDPEAYVIVSDTEPDTTWKVTAHDVAGAYTFWCTCHAGRNARLCKHSQLVARRLEREGRAELTAWGWVDPNWAPKEDDADDPFEGL